MYLYLKCFKLNFFPENIFMILLVKGMGNVYAIKFSAIFLCECQHTM